jgi:hypothetical protein
MTEAINLKPAGLETPEGEQRVAKAHEAFEKTHFDVAVATINLLDKWGDQIRAAIVQCGEEAIEDLDGVEECITAFEDAQDEQLRAVAGYPARRRR